MVQKFLRPISLLSILMLQKKFNLPLCSYSIKLYASIADDGFLSNDFKPVRKLHNNAASIRNSLRF